MPDDHHPGFAIWDGDPLQFPNPVGTFQLIFADSGGANATCEFDLPAALPAKKVYAESSIGIADSYKFWLAVECTTEQNGSITYEILVRGRHLHWFKAHQEDDIGPELAIRLSAAEARASGWKQVLGGHTFHCDSFSANWGQTGKGRGFCSLTGFHYTMTPDEFRTMQENNRKNAEHDLLGPHLHLKPDFDLHLDHPQPQTDKPRPEN